VSLEFQDQWQQIAHPTLLPLRGVPTSLLLRGRTQTSLLQIATLLSLLCSTASVAPSLSEALWEGWLSQDCSWVALQVGTQLNSAVCTWLSYCSNQTLHYQIGERKHVFRFSLRILESLMKYLTSLASILLQ